MQRVVQMKKAISKDHTARLNTEKKSCTFLLLLCIPCLRCWYTFFQYLVSVVPNYVCQYCRSKSSNEHNIIGSHRKGTPEHRRNNVMRVFINKHDRGMNPNISDWRRREKLTQPSTQLAFFNRLVFYCLHFDSACVCLGNIFYSKRVMRNSKCHISLSQKLGKNSNS